MFTHFGISGPLVLSASSKIVKKLDKNPLSAFIDLKPALTDEQLDARLLRDFSQEKNKQFKNALNGLFPARLAEQIVILSGINPDKEVNAITKEERAHLVSLTKNLPLTILSVRSYNEAIITQGGVKVQEVQPKTMESKDVYKRQVPASIQSFKFLYPAASARRILSSTHSRSVLQSEMNLI